MLVISILSFFLNVFNPIKYRIIKLATYNPSPRDKFLTLPSLNGLQTTTPDLTKMAESSPKGLKTLWGKRRYSYRAITPFFTVFIGLVLQTRKKPGLVREKVINLSSANLLNMVQSKTLSFGKELQDLIAHYSTN